MQLRCSTYQTLRRAREATSAGRGAVAERPNTPARNPGPGYQQGASWATQQGAGPAGPPYRRRMAWPLSSQSLATHIAAQALSNSLYKLALLRAPPPPAWASAWAAAFAAVALRADAQHITNGLWAMAALGLRAEVRVLEAALRAAALKAPAFTVQVSQRDARAVGFLDGRRVWWAAVAGLVVRTAPVPGPW